jgi:hypothetical protein
MFNGQERVRSALCCLAAADLFVFTWLGSNLSLAIAAVLRIVAPILAKKR